MKRNGSKCLEYVVQFIKCSWVWSEDLLVKTPQKKKNKSHTVRSGLLGGRSVGPRRLIHLTVKWLSSPARTDKLPSGRAMAVVFSGIFIINVYAPSGTAKHAERKRYYNMELPNLLSEYTNPILMGGDFNCILQPVDTTGTFTTSNALAEIVRGLRLTDMWDQDPRHPTFTHYFPTGASRIDLFYLSTTDKDKKTGIEIIPIAYTHHHAVVLRLSIPAPETRLRRGRWKINPEIVRESPLKKKF